MLGKRVAVWWTSMRVWYVGVVVGVHVERKRTVHSVMYDADGVACWHHLVGAGAVKWKEAPEGKFKP
jgi:hypothetical protein